MGGLPSVKIKLPKLKLLSGKKKQFPVGLDIGSETVPEIAVSIISEIINHYRNGTQSELSISKK